MIDTFLNCEFRFMKFQLSLILFLHFFIQTTLYKIKVISGKKLMK
jgi:hypothetical protein